MTDTARMIQFANLDHEHCGRCGYAPFCDIIGSAEATDCGLADALHVSTVLSEADAMWHDYLEDQEMYRELSRGLG